MMLQAIDCTCTPPRVESFVPFYTTSTEKFYEQKLLNIYHVYFILTKPHDLGTYSLV